MSDASANIVYIVISSLSHHSSNSDMEEPFIHITFERIDGTFSLQTDVFRIESQQFIGMCFCVCASMYSTESMVKGYALLRVCFSFFFIIIIVELPGNTVGATNNN